MGHPKVSSTAQSQLLHDQPLRACLPRRVQVLDVHDRCIDYLKSWEWQKLRAVAVRNDTSASSEAVLLLQHTATYTLGTYGMLENLKFDPETFSVPLYRTDRGGEVTFHGPGQLVLYVILDLKKHGQDLHLHLRRLEETVIQALREVSGIEAFRIDGLSGVWTDLGKVAATGVRAKNWVSYHGIALNVCPDMAAFGLIVPCGISNREVCSVQQLHQYYFDEAWQPGCTQMLDEYSFALLEAVSAVFEVELVKCVVPSDLTEAFKTISK